MVPAIVKKHSKFRAELEPTLDVMQCDAATQFKIIQKKEKNSSSGWDQRRLYPYQMVTRPGWRY